jgi:hypothetical protein
MQGKLKEGRGVKCKILREKELGNVILAKKAK